MKSHIRKFANIIDTFPINRSKALDEGNQNIFNRKYENVHFGINVSFLELK